MGNQLIYQIGLTKINGVGDITARQLLQALGDAEAVFTEKHRLLEKIPNIGSKTIAAIKDPQVLLQAEKELAFIEKNQIRTYFLADDNYPMRLRECADAPILFYFKGEAELNARRIISIVGTRMMTEYGRTLTETLVKELATTHPDLLIISGLAYGVDICAHRSALRNQLSTVGVLAHGLDRIYPPTHRNTAVEMLSHGGLLTEFASGTLPDRPNFVMRNRIVAGLADATVVVESSEKGGSLITADIAFSYGRDVFTFPGRTTDPHSRGCNGLLRQNKAGLITSADDLIKAMCWDVVSTQPQAVQTAFAFPEDEDPITALIREKKEIHINELALLLKMPIHTLSPLLFELEMDGHIRALPGNIYKAV